MVGGGIAAKIASIIADTTIATRQKAVPLTRDAFMVTQDSFFQLVGSEIRDTVGEIFTQIADDPEAPGWAKRTFNFLGRSHGQWQAFLAQNAAGQALSVGLGDLITNSLAPVIHRIIAALPNGIPDLSALINEIARGHSPDDANSFEIRAHGLTRGYAERLVRLAQHDLSPGDVLDALNRGVISEGHAVGALRDAGFTENAIGPMLRLRQARLSPEQAADLENFGVISREQGRKIAAQSGMSETDYDKLALGGGQPPPLGDLYDALRRGIIDERRFAKGVAQGPIRTEWTDVIEKLKTKNAPVAAALDAATQNLLSKPRARKIWTEEGFPPEDFDWALETSGRPLSPEQAGELYNRGIMSRRDVEQMFLESNIKNKYVPLIFRLAERLPPMELTVRMVREGAMTREEAIANLRALGFADRYATALVDLGTRESMSGERELSISTIQELYEGRIIDHKTAMEGLEAHGYSTEAAEWILSVRDLRRDRRRLDAAIARVRARFVNGRISDRDAQNALDRLQVPADARDELIDTWEIERDINRPLLTVAQIQGAVKRGIFSQDEGMSKLMERGYSEDDAAVIMALTVPAPR